MFPSSAAPFLSCCSSSSHTYTQKGCIFPLLVGYLRKTSENDSRLLPDVGSVVTCKVSSINSRFAEVHILCSFRPYDVVLAKVISLADAQSNHLLTTAKNELGAMVPISWCEMQCPKIHTKEFQKVTREQPDFLQTSAHFTPKTESTISLCEKKIKIPWSLLRYL
ncbi:unknown_gene_12607 [Phodopus roborovskii]|uniref:Unknown_gene_12607 protein n=1 Tax=Phodopus roborovskii TaxID=109678 RepID=A0AAV0A9Y3_PHORO|nr:unknown_gene_12607 [Phodopus roborovskii]